MKFSIRALLRLVGLRFALGLFAMTAFTSSGAETDLRQLSAQIDALRAQPLSDLAARGRLVLRALGPEEIAAARPLIFDSPPSYANDVLGVILLERWGEIDGPEAYAYAATIASTQKPACETAALVGWSRVAPQAAWTRLMLISNRGADRRYAEDELLIAIAESDLPLALNLFQDLTAERTCLLCNASGLVVCALRHRQLPLIAAEIARLPRGPSRNGLRDAYWSITGRYALPDALASLGEITDKEDAQAARVHLAQGWAGQDFGAAFDYVLAHYDRSDVDEAVLPMIQVWAQGAVAEDVRAVIKKLPENLSERSLLGLVPVLARVDPLAATEWAVSFSNPAIRRECLHRSMWQWAQTDGEAAQAYLRSKIDLDVRGFLLRSFVLSRVSNNTLQLADLDDLTIGFNVAWSAGVLEELTLRLADPSANRAAAFDLKAYAAWVNSRKIFDPTQRARILRALQPSSGTQP